MNYSNIWYCKFLGVFLILLMASLPAEAGDAGVTSAEVLRIGSGAARPAMDGAGVAAVRGPSSLQYNPAGLAFSRDRDIEFTYQELVEDIGYGNLDYTHKVDITGEEGVVGGGVRYLSYGSEDRTVFNSGNGDLERDGSFSSADVVFSAGYGETWNNDFSWGATLKLGRLEIDDESAGLMALDLGMQWHSPDPELPLSAGIILANLGPDVEFDSQGDDLPLLSRMGVSYDFASQFEIPVQLHTDLEYQFESEETGLLVGGEWWALDQFVVRAGYDGNVDVDSGWTAGFGYRYDDNLSFDYGYIPYGEFDDLHKLAFTYRLGGANR